MARHRRYGKKSGGSGMGKVGSMVRQLGMGYLGAMVGSAVASKFAPQYSGIASIGGAFLTGGMMGALGIVILQGRLGGSSTNNSLVVV